MSPIPKGNGTAAVISHNHATIQYLHDSTKAGLAILIGLFVLITVSFLAKIVEMTRKGTKLFKGHLYLVFLTFTVLLGQLATYMAYTLLGGFDEFQEKRILETNDAGGLAKQFIRTGKAFIGLYYLSLFLVKATILHFYYHSFTDSRLSFLRRLEGKIGSIVSINGFLLFVWAHFVVLFWATENFASEKNSALGFKGSHYVGIMNACMDLGLLAVPVAAYFGKEVIFRKGDGWKLCVVLAIGCFATVASVLRVAWAFPEEMGATTVSKAKFVQYTSCSVEVSLGYLTLCMPALWAVIPEWGCWIGRAWVKGVVGARGVVRRRDRASRRDRWNGESESQIELVLRHTY